MTARALHSRKFHTPSDTSAIVQIAKVKDSGENAEYEELNEGNWDDLYEAWANLPPFDLPMSEREFAAYRAAFDANASRFSWMLSEFYGSHNGQVATQIFIAEDAHRRLLRELVETGSIAPLSATTNMPTPRQWKANSLITLEDLRGFSSRLQITVTVSDAPQITEGAGKVGRPFWRDTGEIAKQRDEMLIEFRRLGGNVTIDRNQTGLDQATIVVKERGVLQRLVNWDGRNRKTVTTHLKKAAIAAASPFARLP